MEKEGKIIASDQTTEVLLNPEINKDPTIENEDDDDEDHMSEEYMLVQLSKSKADVLESPENKLRERSENAVIPSPEKHVKPKSIADLLRLNSGDSFETCFSHQFEAIKLLGHGTFGRVIHARELTSNLEYAVKVIAKKNLRGQQLDRVRGEAIILSQLQKHENIVKFNRVFESETRLFIVMELLSGGTLRSLMNARLKQVNSNGNNSAWFTEAEVATIMRSIISGVCYFHSKSIVHRDLKPENILIRDSNDLSSIKIADFGLSAASEANRSIQLTQQCGTLIYMAPEFFAQRTYSKPIDIWSCAMILYQLLNYGKHPLYDSKIDNPESYRTKMQSPPQTIPFPADFPQSAQNLLIKMTLLDSSSRYSANQVASHPWITQKPDSDVPLTMSEMLNCLQAQESLHQISKVLLFVNLIRYKNINNNNNLSSPQKDVTSSSFSSTIPESYKSKLKMFSLSKKRSINVSVNKIENNSDVSPNTATSVQTLDSTSNNLTNNNNNTCNFNQNIKANHDAISDSSRSSIDEEEEDQRRISSEKDKQYSQCPQQEIQTIIPNKQIELNSENQSSASVSPIKQLSTQSASPPQKRRNYKKHNSLTLQRGQLNIFTELINSPGQQQSKQINSRTNCNSNANSNANANANTSLSFQEQQQYQVKTSCSDSYSPVIVRDRSDLNSRRTTESSSSSIVSTSQSKPFKGLHQQNFAIKLTTTSGEVQGTNQHSKQSIQRKEKITTAPPKCTTQESPRKRSVISINGSIVSPYKKPSTPSSLHSVMQTPNSYVNSTIDLAMTQNLDQLSVPFVGSTRHKRTVTQPTTPNPPLLKEESSPVRKSINNAAQLHSSNVNGTPRVTISSYLQANCVLNGNKNLNLSRGSTTRTVSKSFAQGQAVLEQLQRKVLALQPLPIIAKGLYCVTPVRLSDQQRSQRATSNDFIGNTKGSQQIQSFQPKSANSQNQSFSTQTRTNSIVSYDPNINTSFQSIFPQSDPKSKIKAIKAVNQTPYFPLGNLK